MILLMGMDNPVEIPSELTKHNGFEWQNLEFINAIKEGRSPNASADEIFPSMESLTQT